MLLLMLIGPYTLYRMMNTKEVHLLQNTTDQKARGRRPSTWGRNTKLQEAHNISQSCCCAVTVDLSPPQAHEHGHLLPRIPAPPRFRPDSDQRRSPYIPYYFLTTSYAHTTVGSCLASAFIDV